MSPSLIIASCGFAFLLLFTLSLFVFIVLRRFFLGYQGARHGRLYRLIEKDVLEAISTDDPGSTFRVAERHRFHPSVLTKVLLDYGLILSGDGKERLKVIFDLVLKERCLKDLSSVRIIKRLKSARLFVIFFNPGESPILLNLLHDKPIIKLAAITALARMPSPETLHLIFKAFEEDRGPTLRSYFNIMFGLGERIEPLVTAGLKKPLSPEKLGLLIELVGAVPLRTLAEEIRIFSDHPDKEIRIRVARALGKLLIPDSVSTLISLAADNAWEVKAQAVKSLGKLRKPETLGILTQSLFSPNWYVRYNAGYGLAGMGKEGLRRLKQVAAQKEDRYASEMSVMVLNDLAYLEEPA
jgi:hypothetical protein